MTKKLKSVFEKGLEPAEDWNAQQSYLQMVMNRWDEVSKASISGDLRLWYRLLHTFWIDVRYRIKQKLFLEKPKDERLMSWDDYEKNVNITFSNIKNQTFTEDNSRLKWSQAEEDLRKLQSHIYEKVFETGLIFPIKEYQTWQDRLRSQFL